MDGKTFDFKASDDKSLFVYHWPVAAGTAARGVVHIAHGMAEHAARYARLARFLNEAGFEVYANDHRGHGKSIRDESERGFFGKEDSWNRAVLDLRELNDHIQEAHPGLPIVLFGHSMGSFMTQQYLYEHPQTIRAAVLSGSNGKVGFLGQIGRLVARTERRRLGPRGQSNVLNNLSFGAYNKAFKPARTEFDWLSRDPTEVDAYEADPDCGFICTTQLWVDLLGGLIEMAKPANQARVPNDLPTYIFAGEKDPVSNGTKGLKQLLAAYQKAGLNQVTHRFYNGGRHEMLNETNRDEVFGDLLAWLDDVLPQKG